MAIMTKKSRIDCRKKDFFLLDFLCDFIKISRLLYLCKTKPHKLALGINSKFVLYGLETE